MKWKWRITWDPEKGAWKICRTRGEVESVAAYRRTWEGAKAYVWLRSVQMERSLQEVIKEEGTFRG